MIFNQSTIPEAINIPFNWVGEYADNTYVSEYDFETQKHNDFYSINQNKIKRFGLIGQNMKFYYEDSDGSFYLNGKHVDVIYEVDGVKHCLTKNSNKKDVVTYKEAHANYNNRDGAQKSNLDSINFGYKTKYIKDDLEIYFQPIVSLPFNESAFIEVKLTSNQDLNGELIFLRRKKEERFDAPLEKDTSGQINWVIK